MLLSLAGTHPRIGWLAATGACPAATEVPGDWLLLKAFAAGCSALTGVEAIENDVPAFRAPTARSAMRTEVLLGVLLPACCWAWRSSPLHILAGALRRHGNVNVASVPFRLTHD
jgi:hypothetical protein